jgi:hypothetical protein
MNGAALPRKTSGMDYLGLVSQRAQGTKYGLSTVGPEEPKRTNPSYVNDQQQIDLKDIQLQPNVV